MTRGTGTMLRSVAMALAAALVLAGPAAAQVRDYPSRTGRMIVAAAPGGNPDVLGRVLAQKLTEDLGRPFIIENVPGAGGVAAAGMAAEVSAVGHVPLLGGS